MRRQSRPFICELVSTSLHDLPLYFDDEPFFLCEERLNFASGC